MIASSPITEDLRARLSAGAERYLAAAHGADQARQNRVPRAGSQHAGSYRRLREWASHTPGEATGRQRHHWDLPRLGRGGADQLIATGLWRPREVELLRTDPTSYGDRVLVPVMSSSGIELLALLADDPERLIAETATRLLAEEQPLVEDELARNLLARDTWADSLALWCYVRQPHAMLRFNPLLTALTARLAVAARRSGGLVVGRRFPFHDVPLVSASAHLATAILELGIYSGLLPSLMRFVADAQRADGGWGDQEQPSDVLTTLAVAELLTRLDPDIDTTGVLHFLVNHQRPDGSWSVLGPEGTWLTGQIHDWLRQLAEPFAERFRWPTVLPWLRDRRLQIPGYAHFLDLDRLFRELPTLRHEPLELAFIDLAGFGDFNTTHGMAVGDRALRLVADTLAAVRGACAIRDGGDEFLVLGAPRRDPLEPTLAALLTDWPARWHQAFGDLPVAPMRGLVTSIRADRLVSGRERLGREIGPLKDKFPHPPPEGVLRPLGPAAG